MRIAMVSEHASPLATLGGEDAGGQNVHVAALATALARRGATVTVYTRRDAPELPRVAPLTPGVEVEHVDAGPPEPVPKDHLLPHMDDFAAVLRRRFAADPPQVVHAHFWMSGRAAIAAARPLGIPVLQTFHALGVVKQRHQGAKDTSPACRIQEECRILARAQHVIATCRDEVDELERLGASRRRTSIVPCGVDLGMFRPDGPVESRPARRRRLVAVGRLVERKGLGDAIAALRELPDAELVIAGGPPCERLAADAEAGRLTRLARELGVADRVELRGGVRQSEVPALLRSADVAVCVPWYEPFGIVPLEAMACGVPVVGAAVGGLLDSVVDGETGLHVPPRNPSALAAAVRRLLADETLRRNLGGIGALRASRYAWPAIAQATLGVYRATLAQHRVTRLESRRRQAERPPAHAAAVHARRVVDRGR